MGNYYIMRFEIILGLVATIFTVAIKFTIAPYISFFAVVWPAIACTALYFIRNINTPLIQRSKSMQDQRVLDELIQPYIMTGVKYFGDIKTVCIFYKTVREGTGLCKAYKNGEVWLHVRMADTGRWEKWRRATMAEIDGAYESALSNDIQLELLNQTNND